MKRMFAMVAALFTSCGVPAFASPIGGARMVNEIVESGHIDVYVLFLRGGERTTFAVRGDGSGDLDCAVFTMENEPLASDIDNTDTCYIDLYSPYTQQIRFGIANHGSIANSYTMGIK